VTEEPILVARDLEVRYGATDAVRGLSIEVHPGEVVGLIGPDGAGKTSTLRVLGGLQRASGGTTLAFGDDCWRGRRALHRRLGYLAQRFALYGDLTVDENVQFFALMYGVRDWRDRRSRLLDMVGLTPFQRRIADRLSGGMKQKLALACTLIHSPEVLLLDEPTTGVDPVTRREFWRLLADLVGNGLTLVVATPYLDEAERCTRVVLMNGGLVLTDEAPSEIPALVPGVVVEVTAEPRTVAAEALAADPAVVDVTVFGSTLHVRLEADVDPLERVRRALSAPGIEVDGVAVIPAGLEDAFLYLNRYAADEPALEART
jgi:ABC-2 type transport system ATP-binding protein